jgi:hypothetical protein
MLDITSKFRIIFMYVFVNLKQYMFQIQRVDTFVIYLHNKVNMPSSGDSIVIGIRPKTRENFRMVSMLLLYIQQKH